MNKYAEVLSQLESFRANLLLEHLEQEKQNLYLGEVESNNQNVFQPLWVNDYPVLQFRYEGALPLYKDKKADYIALIRKYYFQSTVQTYHLPAIEGLIQGKATILIQHIFKNNAVRDLDNRNRKYIIDAIRFAEIIPDDNFRNLSIFEEGLVDDGPMSSPFVNVYILEERNFHDFYSQRLRFTFRDKEDFSHVMTIEELEKQVKMKNEKSLLNSVKSKADFLKSRGI